MNYPTTYPKDTEDTPLFLAKGSFCGESSFVTVRNGLIGFLQFALVGIEVCS